MVDRETLALILSILAGLLQVFQGRHHNPTPSPSPDASPVVVVSAPPPTPLPTPAGPPPAGCPTPPAAASPCPIASATPRPTPFPEPTPPPFPTPAPGPTVPPDNVCPGEFDHPPTVVTIGENPLSRRDLGTDRVYTFNTTPRDNPPYCPHRGNTGMCEQWAACAIKYTPDATQTLVVNGRPVFENEPVERASNNQYLLRIRISPNPDDGSQPGLYYICVAPPGGILTVFRNCREYHLSLPD